jgi:pyrimidine operon attenuation protein/uracil phosphoribosyltransferase
MDARTIGLAVRQVVRAIASRTQSADQVVLVGVQTGGVWFAQHLADHLKQLWGKPVPVGQLDISMHRDDLDQRLAPKVYPTEIGFDVTGKTVILVDDVLFSGRTARAAMDALTDLGRPRRIQLAVLIDRGHRELPIEADFVGKRIPTDPADRVDVQLADTLAASQVVLEKAAQA